MRGYYRQVALNPDKILQPYVIGLAIGDGNLSNPNGRAVRLRVTCDTKYPKLIDKITTSLKTLFPNNKVGIIYRASSYLDISVYSNSLEDMLGWHVGSKAAQNVSIPDWIFGDKEYLVHCLCGLIETDGSIYFDRGYKMVIFKTIIEKLAKDFSRGITELGFAPKVYKIKEDFSRPIKQQAAYHVRLSKNVQEFIADVERG